MSAPSSPPPVPRPRKFPWLPLYIWAGLLGLLTPAAVWGFLTGRGVIIFFLIFPFGVLLLVAAAFTGLGYLALTAEPKLSPGNPKNWLCALAIQGVGLSWLLFLVGAIGPAEKLAVHWSRENGQAVASAVEEFRSRHGRYPTSLEEAEQDLGRQLPRPIYASQFYYRAENGTYSLSFPVPHSSYSWWFNEKTGTWFSYD